MKHTLFIKLAIALACICAVDTGVYALTINDPGVVGTVDGLAGDNANEEAGFAQHLLDLAANTTNNSYAVPPSGVAHIYDTSSTEYNGTLNLNSEFSGAAGLTLVPAGYDYVLAKYDGQNAGYVLFYLGGQAFNLPATSYSIWGSNSGQYAISHYTAWTASVPSVPDGGSTVALFGVAILGIAGIRRKLTSQTPIC